MLATLLAAILIGAAPGEDSTATIPIQSAICVPILSPEQANSGSDLPAVLAFGVADALDQAKLAVIGRVASVSHRPGSYDSPRCTADADCAAPNRAHESILGTLIDAGDMNIDVEFTLVGAARDQLVLRSANPQHVPIALSIQLDNDLKGGCILIPDRTVVVKKDAIYLIIQKADYIFILVSIENENNAHKIIESRKSRTKQSAQ